MAAAADERRPADERWMRRALALAARGRGTTSPNPMVGCVLLRDGEVVGEGWHERAGGPHAEIEALSDAGEAARGATAYVTLEPCAHTGRTGPCSEALLHAGVARVVFALADPNPLARGGADALRAAGVSVTGGICEDQARDQNEVFLHGLAAGRPFVVVKGAVSFDGRIAAADGTSRWLTGEAARRRGHELRAEVDAVLVGSGTVVADDPQLTVRRSGYSGPQPLRAVLDGRGRTSARHRVVDGAAPTVVYTRTAGTLGDDGLAGRLAPADAEVVAVAPAGPGGLDLDEVLADLWERGARSVLVEGGAAVTSSFLRAGLADRFVLHLAPLLLGEHGRPLVVGPWAATIEDAPRLRIVASEQVGADVVVDARPLRPAPAPLPAAEPLERGVA